MSSSAPILVLAVLLPACAPPPAAPPAGPDGVVQGAGPDDLESARDRWEDADIDDYTFTIRRSCFCPPEYIGPYRIMVRAGRITGVMVDGRSVSAQQFQVPTVAALFDQLAEAYSSGAAEVRASYDARIGHPVEIWIDQDRSMADEETGFTISSFVIN